MTPGNAMLSADSLFSSACDFRRDSDFSSEPTAAIGWLRLAAARLSLARSGRSGCSGQLSGAHTFAAFSLLVLLLCGCSPAPPSPPRLDAVEEQAPQVETRPAETPPTEPGAEVGGLQLEAESAGAEPVGAEPAAEDAIQSGAGAAAASPSTDPRPLQAPPAEEREELDPNDGKSPAELAAERAFGEPEGARRLSPDARLWVDPQRGRLIVDGYVTLREGPLEMFACPVGTKEHESVVSVLARSRYVHAGLLAIGAMPGTPVSFNPEYRPATGQRIAIWVMWRDAKGEIQKVPAQKWVQQTGTNDPLEAEWVFAGSSFWRDPESGQEYYQADSGDLVCVSNFSTATLDLPVESSQSNAALQYSAFTAKIPPRGTPVRLVFVPVPLPADDPEPTAEQRADPRRPPEDDLLPSPSTPPQPE